MLELDVSQFRNRLCREMFGLATKNLLCDTRIKCGDRLHPCHKLVLAAASPLLRAIIYANSLGVSDLDIRLDCLSLFDVDCLLEYLYTGVLATESHDIDSTLSAAIEIFTEEKYAGLSLDQALNLVLDQSLRNDTATDSTVKDTVEIIRLAEVNDRNSCDESQIVCHIETNPSAREFADRVHSDGMESTNYKDERPIAKSDGHISAHKKRSRLIGDSRHFSTQTILEAPHESYGDEELGRVEIKIAESSCMMKKAAYVRSHVKLPQKPPFLCPCQNCGKIFESHQRLRSHYRHTHGEKKYKCDLCPLRFLYPKDLRSHVRTHTGEKPFVCEMCGKGFAQMGSLKIHYKVHEKHDNDNVVFRPCPECAKKFCLKERDKNVDYLNCFSTDLTSCICPNSNCAKKFSSVKCLKKHLKNDVCNPNKYHCGKCYAKFDNNMQLRYHVGTMHCTHKKRKKVKPGHKEVVSHDASIPDDHNNFVTPFLSGFENGVDNSPMLCNVEEISGLLQLSEEVVIKGDE